MKRAIILPKIQSFALRNFRPIFNKDVELPVREGVNIVLGGNGLGKTTIMQAIVYALSGGTEAIEENRQHRWNHKYFATRLREEEKPIAFIEVVFKLGTHQITVRRGFQHSAVLALKIDKHPWIEEQSRVDLEYARALDEFGGYGTANEFAFIVHTLLYLPETRRLIAWDTDLQITLLMLLNQDLAPERAFDARRADLTKLDSNRRHRHVELVKVQEWLDAAHQKRSRKPSTTKVAENETDVTKYQKAVSELQRIGKERLGAEREASKIAARLSELSEQVEKLREQIDAAEASLVLETLTYQELEVRLSLQKLIELAICPACGTRQAELQATAKQHAAHHSCVLCGSNVEQATDFEISTLRSRLTEKLRGEKALQEELLIANANLEHQLQLESHAQWKVNDIRFAQPAISLEALRAPIKSVRDLINLRNRLVREEADYASQIDILSRELERDYERFRRMAATRAAKLKSTYQKYATQFLGVSCQLVEVEDDGRLLNLMRFIPIFDGIERPTSNSCSEAQRFFLDIAFRMALIDVSSGLSEYSASFLCETPETALDLTYVENVVSMLTRFGDEGHSCLYTVNIQEGGIGEQLLDKMPASERRSRVLNLIEISNLSTVQRQKKDKIDKVVKRMLG